MAEQLHLVPRIIAVQPEADATRRVAVPTGVDQAHVGDGLIERDRVDTFARVAARAVPFARRPGGELRVPERVKLKFSVNMSGLSV